MDDMEAGRYWEGNAESWTRLARLGYDVQTQAALAEACRVLKPGGFVQFSTTHP